MNVAQPPPKLAAAQGLTLKLYERGCALLEQCVSFDETKYWDSLADAAAAWAKIHDSDRVEQLARSLKLHAYRRLGQIAEMQQPVRAAEPRLGRRTGRPCGRPPGPVAWLQQNGMRRNEAVAARTLGVMQEAQFTSLAGAERPLSPVSVRRGQYSPWQLFYQRAQLANVAANTWRMAPIDAARLEGLEQREKILRVARRLERWFKEFADTLEIL
jgi:hypothetical protein